LIDYYNDMKLYTFNDYESFRKKLNVIIGDW